MRNVLLAVIVVAFAGMSGCAPAAAEEEIDEGGEALSAIDCAPALQFEFNRIKSTPTGRDIVSRARARGLHTIKVGPLGGNVVGLYQSNGVITIESPNTAYTFQRLAHELLHADGHHPHYFPDKGLIGKMCREANATCPSWDTDMND
jgi:hypothetical protein